jgi:hypothetical protein
MHLALSRPSLRSKRHESAMSIVMNGKCCHRFDASIARRTSVERIDALFIDRSLPRYSSEKFVASGYLAEEAYMAGLYFSCG